MVSWRENQVRQCGTASRWSAKTSSQWESQRRAVVKSKHWWRWLDGTDSAARNTSNLVFKSMRCRYNLYLFPFCCGLLADFICVACIEPNSVSTSILYPLVAVSDWIPYTIGDVRWSCPILNSWICTLVPPRYKTGLNSWNYGTVSEEKWRRKIRGLFSYRWWPLFIFPHEKFDISKIPGISATTRIDSLTTHSCGSSEFPSYGLREVSLFGPWPKCEISWIYSDSTVTVIQMQLWRSTRNSLR